MPEVSSDEPVSRPAEAWWIDARDRLARGEPLIAYDTAREGLRSWPGDVRLRRVMALALARSGAAEDANAMAAQLEAEGQRDEETLGLLARTHKDLAAAAHDPTTRRRQLRQALEWYERAYTASHGIWSGINVATTAFALDERETSQRMAEQVRHECLKQWKDAGGAVDYWLLATLGEAMLLSGDLAAAEEWYSRAAEAGRDRLGDRVATRRNARLILTQAGLDPAQFDRCFGIPKVVVCVGHLIDRPGRASARFPAHLEPAIRAAIRAELDALDAGIGFASAAAGADIMALECLTDRGAITHVVLPYARDEFIRDSVAIDPSGDWISRFERVLTSAADVVVASPQRLGKGAASYEYAFRILDGSAGVLADELDTELIGLAVWNGESGDGGGGTAAAVEHWRRRGRRIEIIDTKALLARSSWRATPSTETVQPVAEVPALAPLHAPAYDARVVALLFADVVGFSGLADDELPVFVDEYLGMVAAELDGLVPRPLLVNTWGDGLYGVFGSVREAGVFALRLCDRVRRTDWILKGLRAGLDVRIGLHAGPAYGCVDPVTRRPSFVGAHVSRAARIEPVTPPGAAYASRQFAALARTEGVSEFTCSYVGPMPLPKGFGTFPTYAVRAR